MGVGPAIAAIVSCVVLRAQAPQLVVSSATPDPSGQTMTIVGQNFAGAGNVSRPLVTLDLVPLTVQFAVDAQIVVAVPIASVPPGTYVLTVSRGPAPTDTGSIQLTIGTPTATATAAVPPAPATTVIAERPPDGSAAAARVGDRVITVADVDREWQRTDPVGFLALNRDLYTQRRRTVDQMVNNEILAREASTRGVTVDALLAAEIPKRVVTVPESALLSLYQGLGDKTRGATLDQMRPALRAWMARVAEPELAKMNYVEELMKVSTKAEILIEPPRVEVQRTAQDESLGPDKAAVEIVAFGDFDSLEYTRFAQAFPWVRETYGDRVRIVFKNLPVRGPGSAEIAEAAACAKVQGQFWPFHDKVIARYGPLGSDGLKRLATELGLNRSAFDRCLDRSESAGLVRDALDEAQRYAIAESPSFLVNGRLAPSPPAFLPPREFFTRLIEEELSRQSRAR